jgi:hypothetical protein
MAKPHVLPLVAAMLTLPVTALAANRVNLSPRELAQAINQADASLVPYGRGKLSPADLRMIRCVRPDEEPTEFECTWRQRAGLRWASRKAWLAIDGRGWHIID